MQWNRRVSGLMISIMMLMFLVQPVLAAVQPVPQGTTLPKGSLAVVESVFNGDRVVQVWPGPIGNDFLVHTDATANAQFNAWSGYASVEETFTGACQQATNRRNDPFFSGYTIQLNGSLFAGDCNNLGQPVATATSVPATTSTDALTQAFAAHIPGPTANQPNGPTATFTGQGVQAILPGTMVDGGNWVIVRTIHWDTMTANVSVIQLPSRTYFGSGYDGVPLHEKAGWMLPTGLKWGWIYIDSCGETVELIKERAPAMTVWKELQPMAPNGQSDCPDPPMAKAA